MQITCPDEWKPKFDAYEMAEQILRKNFNECGVSRMAICQTFAAFGGVVSAWKDPAFRAWAALRGCSQSADFVDRFAAEAVEGSETDESRPAPIDG